MMMIKYKIFRFCLAYIYKKDEFNKPLLYVATKLLSHLFNLYLRRKTEVTITSWATW